MTDKEIIIDGVDVSKCRYFLKDTEGQDYDTDEFVKGCCEAKGSCIGYEFAGYGLCRGDKDCYYKQLQKEKFENLNNRQMVESAENLIYENSELYKNLKEKEKEYEELKNTVLTKCPNCNSEYLTPKGIELYEENKKLKKECEELKKEIINKNEKIKELRFSVSDLTNRLCYLNAEKSFRIVDLEQTLDEIEKELKEDIYCENQECGCDDFEECLKCTKEHILDIINKAKGEDNEIN